MLSENTHAVSEKTGGQLLVEALECHGAERVFCVPGESCLAVLDALYDATIPVTLCRQEGGAAMMADAHAKLTGKPGICMVTRGPGATNASSGVHVAEQDSTPMILLVGQVARRIRERGAFQEIDYRQMFGGIAKWVGEIDCVTRVPEFVSRAYHVATSGRPGPVVLVLPKDVLVEKADVRQAPAWKQVETHPGPTEMADLQKRLWAAKRPIAILGGSRWSGDAVAAFSRFAERFDLPVACSFRRHMLFDNLHSSYAGDVGVGISPKLKNRIKASDLVLLVGGRLSEKPSQSYTLLEIPAPRQQLIHVHPDMEELGRVYRASLPIHASPIAFCEALESLQPPADIPWTGSTVEAHQSYMKWSGARPKTPGSLQMVGVIDWLQDNLPDDTILTNGAGSYGSWLHRFFRFRRYDALLDPTSGSMGYGLPAAVAAKLRFPNRDVVCLAGDGCFQMTMQEFGTASQEGTNIIVLVFDNGMNGSIRVQQERAYPGRPSATSLVNPDFAALARSYGAFGETVEATEDFGPAFERARSSGKPAILHLKIDPEAATPTKTLSQIRAAAEQKSS